MGPDDLILRQIKKEFGEINEKIKISFANIREEIRLMETSIERIKNYVKKENKNLKKEREIEDKVREKFLNDADEYTQKTIRLKLALSEIRTIKDNVVLVRDLAKIEERIKSSFTDEVGEYRKVVGEMGKELGEMKKTIAEIGKEKSVVKKKKWFS